MQDRVLIYGPPGAGKSTLAKTLKAQGYLVIEREMFNHDGAFKRAVRDSDREQMAVVRCCFSECELQEWVNLSRATRVVKVDPGLNEAKRRLYARRNSNWKGEIAAAERWYRRDAGAPKKTSRRPKFAASTTQRGYGYSHQRKRRQLKAIIEETGAACVRCGRLITAEMEWHLDHAPGKQSYLGPSHARCNLAAGGKVGVAVKRAQKMAKRRVSRSW